MKKIILISFLSFFISSVSYSKIITFKNCYITNDDATMGEVDPEYKLLKKFDKKMWEEWKYEIDLEKKEIKSVIIRTDHFLELNKKFLEKRFEIKRSIELSGKTWEGIDYKPLKKIDIEKYPLTDVEKNYIISFEKRYFDKTEIGERTITFYLKEKKINISTNIPSFLTDPFILQCN